MTAAPTSVERPAAAPLAWLRGSDPLLLLLRASLLVLLVNSNDDPWVFAAVAVTCVIALPRPAVLCSPWLWGAAFVTIGLRQLMTWHTIDDHIIATTYWCGALALGLTATEPRRTLAASARLLVGALFAFAVGWKLRSGEFLDGSFFRYSLLFDDRFDVVARVVGGTATAALDANIADVNALVASGGGSPVHLREGPRNVAVANVFTYWGVGIEAAVAVAFLLPLRRRFAWLRHATLIAFVASTYVVVPIGGFGSLLLVLGAAMAPEGRLQVGYYLAGASLWAWAGVWPLVFL